MAFTAKNKKIAGIIPPMITVFDDEDCIDEKGTRDHVRFLLNEGAHGVAVGGSTGEFIALTVDERKRLAEVVVDEIGDKGLVLVGSGHYSTKITIELSQHAEKIGADGVMIIPPYYLRPPMSDVLIHFRTLAKNISIPIVLYNNPWFTGLEVDMWQTKELLDERVIVGVKVAHGDVDRVHNLKYLCGEKLSVMYGHDYDALEAFLVGADGWISGLPNLLPKLSRQLYDAAKERKDIDEATRIWYKMLPIIHFYYYSKTGEPHWLPVLKDGLNILGRKVGRPRKPMNSLKDKDRRKLEQLLANL